MNTNNKRINIPIIARVEGEGALDLHVSNGEISRLQLRIYEPPRLFEKFLENREPNEVVDAVARICGICPVAYQMSAVHALEEIFKVEQTDWVQAMRRLFYCGEWIESHSIHIHLLAAPDFLGYPSMLALAKDHPEFAKRGLRLQALGMSLMSLLGKRSVHPVGACVGGFYAAPKKKDVLAIRKQFEAELHSAEELLQWALTLPFPDDQQKFTSVSLRHSKEYPMNQGSIVSDCGLNMSKDEFEKHFQETQVPYSTALHAHLNGEPYLVGPLARVNLNYDHLPHEITDIIKRSTIRFPSRNMFHSIVARCIEIYYAMLEALRILRDYEAPERSASPVKFCAGLGFGATEAPRGLLWHRYETQANGLIKSARIVPPTSQNQARIEEDLHTGLTAYGLQRDDHDLRRYSEMIIRNYDPCISCSTHFLTLNMHRET